MTCRKGFASKGMMASLAAAVLLSACASSGSGGGPRASSRSNAPHSDAEEGGIQTRAIRTAPAARPARNESRPLSALNTPEAIAAREAAARRARQAAASSTAESSAPGLAAFLAAAAENTALPVQGDASILQKGSRVRLQSGMVLHARPNVGSETVTLLEEVELELGPSVYNAAGTWWYVAVGNDSGWLLLGNTAR